MLKAWINFLDDVDPDIITGYNILGFDFKYLHGRAQFLKIKNVPNFGRVRDKIGETNLNATYGSRM